MSSHAILKLPHLIRRVGLLAGLVLLASCGGPGAPVAEQPSDKLFNYAFHEIGELYIRPVSGQALIAAAAGRLTAIDPEFRVAPGPGVGGSASLVIAYQGKTVGSYALPDTNDPAEMSRYLDRVIAVAREVSPPITAASEDSVDHALFNGITMALDRFSRYSPPDLARDLRAERNGYGGIGITLDSSNDEFRITALEPHAPAERGGLRAGDRISAIDGVAAAKHSRAWVVQHLRGAVGSPVTVAVMRSEQLREFHLRRELLIRPVVTVTRDGGIAIFRVGSFNQSTTELIANELKKTGDRPITGIVLDLRGNPGGLLEQAVTLADLFVHDGPISATVGRNPASHQFFAATRQAIAPRVPIVVLVNGGSASAAEILAAALQDVGRAVVVGSASYGKGTVQTVLRLPNDGELTLTWARLVTPAGYLLQGHGVVPTLCTSDLANSAGALDTAVRRARAPAATPARAPLDEAGWAALRRSCPAKHESPTVDMTVAERILTDPALYAAALRALPAATELVKKSPGSPSGLSLTGSERALNSDLR
ncbi:MAG TPA: S41 family peptidase [Stellaceae bacterium]|nr:S41 family peptidase [Stellaceae bacterium]